MISQKIVKAKTQLIFDQPFFASLLCSMPMTPDESIPTMATNGESIRFNPAWVDGLSIPEIVFVLGHEVMHCVFNHMYRKGTRDHKRWNKATDYVINDLLQTEKIGKVIEGSLLDAALVREGNGHAEGVYDVLSKEAEKQPDKGQDSPGPGQPGGSLDDCEDAGVDEADKAQKQAEMKVRVVQAANAAKMCGKLSVGMARLVDDIVKPKVDWREVLRRFLSDKAKMEYSFARPKRRFLADDLCLSSLQGEKAGCFVVAVDCSGSIDKATLDSFAAEIKAIVEDTHPAMTHVLYFDSKISHAESYGPYDSLDIKPHGGGGTAFSPIFEHIRVNDLQPIACVVLTDLYANDFGPVPAYPVLWASNGRVEAPFGAIISMA